MSFETIQELIRPELLILIPVLYFIGVAIKKSATIADKFIPMLLGVIGIVLASIYVVATTPPANAADVFQALFAGITQGVLCAGFSVYVNQLIKQTGKDEDV